MDCFSPIYLNFRIEPFGANQLFWFSILFNQQSAMEKIEWFGFTTFTAHAMLKAITEFQTSPRYDDARTSKVMVLVTDGRWGQIAIVDYGMYYHKILTSLSTCVLFMSSYHSVLLYLILPSYLRPNLCERSFYLIFMLCALWGKDTFVILKLHKVCHWPKTIKLNVLLTL